MAYNRKNKLTLILTIQKLTLEHTNRGVTQEYIYNKLVYPAYFISRGTYYRYLGHNAKQELRKIGMEPTQMKLF